MIVSTNKIFKICYGRYGGSDYDKGYRVLKYEWSSVSPDGNAKGEHDLVIVRLADMYLLRAEAKLHKGDASGALNDVNFVRASRTCPSRSHTCSSL